MGKKVIKIVEKGVERYIQVDDDRQQLPARRIPTGELNSVKHSIDVRPTATQHIEMRTSGVDRALGFLIAHVPLFGAFGVGAVLVAVFYRGIPFWSLATLLIFWLTFVGAWVASYWVTLLLSAEGIGMFEAVMKWAVIWREQGNRWKYIDRRDDDG